jgi:hypothetical protein
MTVTFEEDPVEHLLTRRHAVNRAECPVFLALPIATGRFLGHVRILQGGPKKASESLRRPMGTPSTSVRSLSERRKERSRGVANQMAGPRHGCRCARSRPCESRLPSS